MKITIESTSEIASVNGIDCRVWQGKTESGIPIQALITRIAVHESMDRSEFKKELLERAAPTATLERAFPLRMLI